MCQRRGHNAQTGKREELQGSGPGGGPIRTRWPDAVMRSVLGPGDRLLPPCTVPASPSGQMLAERGDPRTLQVRRLTRVDAPGTVRKIGREANGHIGLGVAIQVRTHFIAAAHRARSSPGGRAY